MSNEYYHVTPSVNVSNIMKHGLKPTIGINSQELGEEEPRIYLFGTLDDLYDAMMNWLGEQYSDEDLTVLKINLPYEIKAEKLEFEYQVFETIPPKYISVTNIEV